MFCSSAENFLNNALIQLLDLSVFSRNLIIDVSCLFKWEISSLHGSFKLIFLHCRFVTRIIDLVAKCHWPLLTWDNGTLHTGTENGFTGSRSLLSCLNVVVLSELHTACTLLHCTGQWDFTHCHAAQHAAWIWPCGGKVVFRWGSRSASNLDAKPRVESPISYTICIKIIGTN